MSCAAALATLDVIEEEGLVDRARAIGAQATARLQALQKRLPGIGEVRGPGAMVAIEFVTSEDKQPDAESVAKIVAKARDAGLVLLSTGTLGNVIRLLPPINLSDAELDEGLSIIESVTTEVLTAAGRSRPLATA